MKILLFLYYFIVSVQFTFVIPNSFIEFSFAALIIIGSHFCEPFFILKSNKKCTLEDDFKYALMQVSIELCDNFNVTVFRSPCLILRKFA